MCVSITIVDCDNNYCVCLNFLCIASGHVLSKIDHVLSRSMNYSFRTVHFSNKLRYRRSTDVETMVFPICNHEEC